MQTGEIGALYEGKTEKAPANIYLKGDQNKQKYTCWDTKGKQKGDTILFEVKALPDYNGKKQFQMDISDSTPVTDVNQDILPENTPVGQPTAPQNERIDSNIYIMTQVIAKASMEGSVTAFQAKDNKKDIATLYSEIHHVVAKKCEETIKKLANQDEPVNANTDTYSGDEYPPIGSDENPF